MKNDISTAIQDIKVNFAVLELLQKQGLNFDNVKNFMNEIPVGLKKQVINNEYNNLGFKENGEHWYFYLHQERARILTGFGAIFVKEKDNKKQVLEFLDIVYLESSYFISLREYENDKEIKTETYRFNYRGYPITFDKNKFKDEEIKFFKVIKDNKNEVCEFKGKLSRLEFVKIEESIKSKNIETEFEIN